MAGHLLQLKLQSIKNGARHDSQHRGTWIATLVFAVLFVAAGAFWVSASLDSELAALHQTSILVGAGLTVAVAIASVFTSPVAAIDPRSLAIMGFSPARSALQALGTAFISIPAAAITLFVVAWLFLWSEDGEVLGVAIAGGALIVATLVVLARLAGLVGEDLRAQRLVSDARSALLLVVILVASPLLFVATAIDWQLDQSESIQAALDVLALSPIAAPWAAPSAAAGGDLGTALLQLGIGAATLLVLFILWQVLASRVASSALSERVSDTVDLGVFGAFGRTPALVVAARTVTYWMRDSRYLVVNVSIIFIPLLALIPLAIVGVEPRYLALLPVPLLAFFIGWTLHNDVAFDGTAVWMHVTSGMSGYSDRLGRALPTLALGTVVVLLGGGVTGIILGDWLTVVAMLGVALGLLFTAVGFSSVGSVLHPYPVARPGDSPFSQPVRSWGSSVLWHPVSGVVSIALMGPAIYAGVMALTGGETWWNWVALGWGVGVGLLACLIGLAIGARLFERRAGQLMAFAQSA